MGMEWRRFNDGGASVNLLICHLKGVGAAMVADWRWRG